MNQNTNANKIQLYPVGFCAFNPFNKSFLKLVYKIFIPAFLANLLESLINFVDIFLIFHYANLHSAQSSNIINAITSVIAIEFIFISTIMGLFAGCTVIASQYFGARQFNRLRQIFNIRILFAIIITILLSLPSFFASSQLVSIILGATHSIHKHDTIVIASRYLQIIAFAIPFIALDFAFIFSLNDTGRNIVSFNIRLATFIARILFSWILIYGAGAIPSLGLNGSAYGLVISRGIELVLLITICLAFKYEFIRNYKERFWNFKLLKQIISKTLPLLFNEIFWSLSIFLNIMALAFLGSEALVSLQITNSVADIGFTIFYGLSLTTGLIIGKSLGEKNIAKTQYLSKQMIGFGIFISIISGSIIFILSSFLPDIIYSKSSHNVIMQAKYLLMIQGTFMCLYGLYGTLFFIIRAGGNSWYPLIDCIYAIFFTTLLLFIYVFSLGNILQWTISQVYAMLFFPYLIRVFIFLFIWKKKNWTNILIE